MKLAEIYKEKPSVLKPPQWKLLVPLCIACMVVTGFMGWLGFPWRLYNDIPSLFCYLSLALIVYKVGVVPVNKFFCYTNKFSYEWYLVHILVFQVIRYLFNSDLLIIEFTVSLFLSYFFAWGYSMIWSKLR